MRKTTVVIPCRQSELGGREHLVKKMFQKKHLINNISEAYTDSLHSELTRMFPEKSRFEL